MDTMDIPLPALLSQIRHSILRHMKRRLSHSTILKVLRQLVFLLSIVHRACISRATSTAKRISDKVKTWLSSKNAGEELLEIHSPGCSSTKSRGYVEMADVSYSMNIQRTPLETVSLEGTAYSLYPGDVVNKEPGVLPQLHPPNFASPSCYPRDRQFVGSELNAHILAPHIITACLNNTRIKPVMPENIKRYQGRDKIQKEYSTKTIEPVHLVFDSRTTPPPWVKLSHPEGGRYYYHPEKKTYTDADICDPRILEQATADVTLLENFILDNRIPFPAAYDLILDLNYAQDGVAIETRYYYVHHQTRAIFFVDAFEAHDLEVWYEIQGVISESLLKHEVEAQYWYHIALFPHSLQITKQLVHEVMNIAIHFVGDNMTSSGSTSPWSSEELQNILTMTTTIDTNINGLDFVGASSFVARIMHIFARSRFYNHHGEGHARIERTSSVHPDEKKRTWLIKIISPVLFFLPDRNLKTFQLAYVDALVHKHDWVPLLKTMNHEWRQVVVFVTVLLNADVGFLSIRGVEPLDEIRRSPAQISIYISIILNIGSVLMGTLLMRVHRGDDIYDFARFLSQNHHPVHSFARISILYSLPYALALWSVVSFLAGVFFLCFQESSLEARSIVGGISGVVLFMSCSTWSSWDHVTGPLNGVKDTKDCFSRFGSGVAKKCRNLLTRHRSNPDSQGSSAKTVV